MSLTTPTPQLTAKSPEHPVAYGVLVYPGFQALDVFGPLDVFTSLTRYHPLKLSIIAETLDPVPTKPINSSFGSEFSQSIVPTHTFRDAPTVDVLLIPGGLGNRPPADMEACIKFIQKTYPEVQYLLTVCTGSYLAARAGILEGKRATTNKSAFRDIAIGNPGVDWVAQARWVVDGNIWTSSGVTAGMDLALNFVSEVYGQQLASSIADGLEYDWHRDADWDPFATRHGLV